MSNYVYIIKQSQDEIFKIGATMSLEERLSQLQTGNANELVLYAYIEVDEHFAMEKYLHSLFRIYKMKGEWYDVSMYNLRMVLHEITNGHRVFEVSSYNPHNVYILGKLYHTYTQDSEDGWIMKDSVSPATSQQCDPIKGSQDVWEFVMSDIKDRVELGKTRYGRVLQTHNGRDALVDAYQEALDLALYLRQAILERENG